MCGIFAILQRQKSEKKDDCTQVIDRIIEAIRLLQNRGYDSAGVTTLEDLATIQNFRVTKRAESGCIKRIATEAPAEHKNAFIGIAHTRWATHGGVTEQNAHPHFSYNQNIALVHNGTITNYVHLQKMLQEVYNIELKSETDSEMIAHIIQLYLDQFNLSLQQTIQKIVDDQIIEGDWGIVVISKTNPNQIVVSRKANPILIGLGEEEIYVSSETIGFQKYTQECFRLDDNEVLTLDLESLPELRLQNQHRMEKLENIKVQVLPDLQYQSWFEQEIYEQPQSVLNVLGNGQRLKGAKDSCTLGGLSQYLEQITNIDNMNIVACGSSLQASRYAEFIFQQLRCFNTIKCNEGSEFNEYDIPCSGQNGVTIVSQSGETADLRDALTLSKQNNALSIGIINVENSQIAQGVNCGVYLNSGRENCVAATKSFTSQVVALVSMALYISKNKDKNNYLSQERQNLKTSLQFLPINIGSTLKDIEEPCQKIAKILAHKSSILTLGRGTSSAIVKEGALKLKELTYIHTEAFSAGELKHGPLALIDTPNPKSTPIILIILNDKHKQDMITCLSEVHARKAQTIVITNCYDDLDKQKIDHLIEIKDIGILSSLLCILPFQKLTQYMCKELRLDPDYPRGLAKCVSTK